MLMTNMDQLLVTNMRPKWMKRILMTIMDQCGTDMDKMDIDDGKNKTCKVDIIDDSKTKKR